MDLRLIILQLCFLCASIFPVSNVFAQFKRISGDFYEITSMWDQEQNYLSFYDNQTFTYHKSSDFGEYFGAGRFTQTDKSISLEFFPSSEARNQFEILEGEVDSITASIGYSLFRATHAINPNVSMMLVYQQFRNDTMVAQGGESPFGVLKIALELGDSLSLTGTDWGQTWLSHSMIVTDTLPKSYVLVIPMRVSIVEPNKSETFGYKLSKTGDKLTLIRNGRPNFFHPDSEKRARYLKK